jgi:hypothetical protein
MDFKDMTRLRPVSQKLSQALASRLSAHLRTLAPLFSPRLVLGEFMESAFRDAVPGASKNLEDIEKRYKSVASESFQLKPKLKVPLPNIANRVEVHPWQYVYDLGSQDGGQIVVTSPVRWVATYAGRYTLTRLLEDWLVGEQPRSEDALQLVLHSLVMCKLLENASGLKALLADLRLEASEEHCPLSGGLPYTVLSAPVAALRPPDSVIRQVTQLSGRPVFEELIDMGALADLPDPLRASLQQVAS